MTIFNPPKFLTRSLISAVGLSAITVLATGNAAQAVTIGPGYDLFTTLPSFGEQESFYMKTVEVPGVGPVNVTIPLTAHPFVPGTNIDTKVRRLNGCDFDQLNPCQVDIQMAGLSLKSREPVTLGNDEFNVKIESGDLLGKPENPIVPMTVTLNQEETGGIMEIPGLTFDVMVTFTPVGGGDSIMQTDTISFIPWVAPWSTTAGPMDAHTDNMPDGGLFAGIDPDNNQKAMLDPHIQPGEAHYFETAMTVTVPEPSTTLGLLFLGLGSVAGLKRKDKAKK